MHSGLHSAERKVSESMFLCFLSQKFSILMPVAIDLMLWQWSSISYFVSCRFRPMASSPNRARSHIDSATQLNYRTQGHLFTSHWITKVPIVLCFVLQKILTHVKQVVRSGPAYSVVAQIDGQNWVHWMQGKHGGERVGKGDRTKTFDSSLFGVVSIFENVHNSCKHQSASIKSFTSGTDTFASLRTVTGHGKSIMPTFAPVRKSTSCWSTLNSDFLCPSDRCCHLCHY